MAHQVGPVRLKIFERTGGHQEYLSESWQRCRKDERRITQMVTEMLHIFAIEVQ